MTANPLATQPAAARKLDAHTLPTLTAQRDRFQTLKNESRREWYEQQLARHTPDMMEEAVSQRSQALLNNIVERLHGATSEGTSSVHYQAIFRHETVGWKFAQVCADGFISGPLDLSMVPFDHEILGLCRFSQSIPKTIG